MLIVKPVQLRTFSVPYSEGTQRILKEQSESNQREREQSDFVIPSEPKILRLVVYPALSTDNSSAVTDLNI